MRLLDDDTSWAHARMSTRFTASALAADPDHASLAPPLQALLETWKGIETDRLAAEDAEATANARVKVVDARLDRQVNQLAKQLQADAPGAFKTFFPEPIHQVVRMGLEAEVARVARFEVVRAQTQLPAPVTAILDGIKQSAQLGGQALEARTQTVLDAAKVSLKQQTWKESANAARRSVENALEQHAITQGLPRGYAADFFPDESRRHRADPAPRNEVVPPAPPAQP